MAISEECLHTLQRLSTPTISNAIETFNIRPRNLGYLTPEIRCLFPDLGTMVGYAVTARFAAEQPPTRNVSRYDFWKYLLEIPEPRVMFMQDLDQPSGVGAYFGEVQSTIHKRLGCVGVVTNGYVRDLDEAHALGFHYFAGGACVSHGYVHLVDFGGPVKVGGVIIRPGDLLHGDKHGVVAVPVDKAAQIAAAAEKQAEKERRILSFCNSPDFSLEKLKELYEK